MSVSVRATYPKFKAWDPTTQEFLSGGLLYTYTRGTTTAKTTYSDAAMTTANANPVVLDAYGEATIFLDGEYKFVLKNSAGTTIWTQDDVNVSETGVTDAGQTAFGIIANGSFEIDSDGDGVPDNWTATTQGTVALDATDARHGSKCYKFTSAGSGGGYITSDFFEVSENNTYSIIFSVKSSVADIRNLVTISWYDLDQVIIAGSPVTVWDDSATNPTSWTEKRFSVTPATGACYAKLIMYGCHSSDGTAGNTKYDYVRMYANNLYLDDPYAIDSLTIESSDSGASSGPVLDLYRNSASPAASDVLGAVKFSGEDSAGNTQTYGLIQAEIVDPTSASEDSEIVFHTAVAGTIAERVVVGQGMQIGAPTGTDKGVGTLNLDNDLYKDGTNITTPTAVSNHVVGHAVYTHDDVSSGTGFDVVANIGSSFETIGKTGSGATNIWTALDAVPSTAKAIILKIYTRIAGSTTTTTYTASVFWRKVGSAVAAGSTELLIGRARFRNTSGVLEEDDTIAFAIVPINSSGVGEIAYTVAGTTPSDAAQINLVGWIDSLI